MSQVFFIFTTVRTSDFIPLILMYNMIYENYGRPGFDSLQRQNFILSTAFRLALVPLSLLSNLYHGVNGRDVKLTVHI
jgi:hypothetical protein